VGCRPDGRWLQWRGRRRGGGRAVPVEVGSDLAGSLRLPAHFCGVLSLKTTEHRVSTVGFFSPPPGVPRTVRVLGALGPIARTLDDLDLVLRVIAGTDGRDADVPPVPLPARRRVGLAGLRLAVAAELPGADVSPSLRAAVDRVAAGASEHGARVSADLPSLDWGEQRLFGELVEVVTGVFDPGAQLADERRTVEWYLTALHRRDAFIAAWERYFDGYDALVLPPAQTTAFGHDATGYDRQGHSMVFAKPGRVADADRTGRSGRRGAPGWRAARGPALVGVAAAGHRGRTRGRRRVARLHPPAWLLTSRKGLSPSLTLRRFKVTVLNIRNVLETRKRGAR